MPDPSDTMSEKEWFVFQLLGSAIIEIEKAIELGKKDLSWMSLVGQQSGRPTRA